MKKHLNRVLAVVLAGVMVSIMPLADIAPRGVLSEKTSQAATKKKRYLSDLKTTMAASAKQAKIEIKELEDEGYTILTESVEDEKTGEVVEQYADLNEDAGTSSALKDGPNQMMVFLGYKTTTDPKEAITDLAVMNMNGGYSLEDYKVFMKKYRETQIVPFLDKFTATINEFRINYKKDDDSLGCMRAKSIYNLLNTFIDDDTGMPIGKLLINPTKYELGEEKYNRLSDSEKKNCADIETILMQANGKATLAIETLLSRATDTSDTDTWLDRFSKTTVDDLRDEIMEDHPNFDKADANSELDKLYHDDAMKLLGEKTEDEETGETVYTIWDSFQKIASEYKSFKKGLSEKEDKTEENMSNFDEQPSSSGDYISIVARINDLKDATNAIMDESLSNQAVGTCEYLSKIKYDGGTLLDFFAQDHESVMGGKGIRKLYPIVVSLTAGQIAGLDFLGLDDLFSIALADEETYPKVEEMMEGTETVSVFEGVEREIYDPDCAVGLTSEALRLRAKNNQSTTSDYKMGMLPTILWCITAGCAVATTVSTFIYTRSVYLSDRMETVATDLARLKAELEELEKLCLNLQETDPDLGLKLVPKTYEYQMEIGKKQLWYHNNNVENVNSLSGKIALGAALVTVIMLGITIGIQLVDIYKYYNVSFNIIPKYIVDEANLTKIDSDGNTYYIENHTAYYKVVPNNRAPGVKYYGVLQNFTDLNGDVGKEWLALYAAKNEFGNPILADSLLCMKNSKSIPNGYKTGIHEFGGKDNMPACNLNNKDYIFNRDAPTIKVYYKYDLSTEDDAEVTGSLFAPGKVGIGIGIGVVFGLVLLVCFGRRKRKMKEGDA